MEEPHIQKDFELTDARQKRIHENLVRLVGPSAAAFYFDACRLMETTPQMKTTTHLIGHALREIESSIRSVLSPLISGMAKPKAKDKSNHATQVEQILSALNIEKSSSIGSAWLELTENGKGLDKKAHRNNLNSPRQADDEFKKFWDRMQGILDVVLERFRANYSKIHDEIDDKTKTYGEKGLKFLETLPQSPSALKYLYKSLEGIQWLAPLEKAGFFGYEQPGRYQWLPALYLARIATSSADNAKQVIKLAERIETDNIRAYEELLDIATTIPASIAAPLASKAVEWADNPYAQTTLMAHNMGSYMQHLAEGGEKQAALIVAEKLITSPLSDPEFVRNRTNWEYEQLFGEKLPSLLEIAPKEIFELTSGALSGILSGKKPHDGSYFWRPTVGEERDVHEHDIKSLLVTAIRDSGVKYLEGNPTELKEIVGALASQKWRIFRNIAFYLLAKTQKPDPDVVALYLIDSDLLDEVIGEFDFIKLAEKHAGLITEEGWKKLKIWFDTKVNTENYEKGMLTNVGRAATEEEKAKYIQRHQRDKLHPFREYLSEDLKEQYNKLVEEAGKPKDTGVGFEMTSWMGPTSPKSAAELTRFTTAQISDYLKTWKPADGWREPTPEGLGRELQGLVKEDPKKFSAGAKDMEGLDPTYIRSIIRGLNESLQDNNLEWSPVLDLCVWAISQPYKGEPSRKVTEDMDPDWGWTRKQIIDLLEEGLKSDKIPYEQKDKVWGIISTLSSDPDPTEEDEANSSMDPLTLSINSTRPDAVGSVIQYVRWLKKMDDKFVGMGSVPEAKAILEDHLVNDPSPAVKSVYGLRLSQIYYIDQDWLTQNIKDIFPIDKPKLWNAAWRPFVSYTQPHSEWHTLLKTHFIHALDSLGRKDPDDYHDSEYRSALVTHLLSLYWHGAMELTDELLIKFYEKPGSELKSLLVEKIGRAIRKESTLSEDIDKRITELLEWRIKQAQTGGDASELAAFGWWVGSEALDPDWMLDRLIEVIELAGHADPYFEILPALERLAPKHPDKVLQALRLLVLSDDRHRFMIVSQAQVRAIILASINKNEVAKKLGEETSNILIADGYDSFREFL